MKFFNKYRKYTLQPLFSYMILFQALFNKKKSQKKLFKSGRHSLFVILKKLRDTKNIKTLILPSLICNEVISIADSLGLNVRFYTVKSNLDFDLSSVHELMSNNKTIFLFINYFGLMHYKKNIDLIKSKYIVDIIEDNCHTVILGKKSQTENITASFNSYRKILPVLSGSDCYFEDQDLELKPRFPNFAELFYSIRWLNLLSIKRHIKHLNQKSVDNFILQSIDLFSKTVIESTSINYYKIFGRRQKNYIFWENYLRKYNLEYFTNAKIINYMLPYAFPCRAKTNESVEYWLLWGKENGIKVIKWPELPEKCKHTIKNENLDKILLFPVNDQFDLKYLIK